MQKPYIKAKPPEKNARKIIELDSKYIVTSTKCSSIVAKHASGAFVGDIDGNVYLDFTYDMSVANTGHCHPSCGGYKETMLRTYAFCGL